MIEIRKNDQPYSKLVIIPNGEPDIPTVDDEQYSILIASFADQVYSHMEQYHKRKRYAEKRNGKK